MRGRNQIFKKQYQFRASLGSTAEWLAALNLGDGWHILDISPSPNQIRLRCSFKGVRNLIEIEVQSTANFDLIGDISFSIIGWEWMPTSIPVKWLEPEELPTLEACHLIDLFICEQSQGRMIVPNPTPPLPRRVGRRPEPIYDQAYVEYYVEHKHRTIKDAFNTLILPSLGDIDAKQLADALVAFKAALSRRRKEQKVTK